MSSPHPQKRAEPASDSELQTASICSERLVEAARRALEAAKLPASGASLEEILPELRSAAGRLDEAGLPPESVEEFRRFVECAETAKDFVSRVPHGHTAGLDCREELYALVVRSLQQLGDEAPRYRESIEKVLAAAKTAEEQKELPRHLIEQTKAEPRCEQAKLVKASPWEMLMGALAAAGAFVVEVIKTGAAVIGAVAAAIVSPLVAGLSAIANSMAGMRPPETRGVWRGGAHSRGSLWGKMKEIVEGRIISDDPQFYQHMAVTDAYVLTGRDGTLTRLDVWARNQPPASRVDVDRLYPARVVPPISKSPTRPKHETECQFDIAPGSLCLPLSPLYKVVAVEFYDKRKRAIPAPEGVSIREGRLGGLVLDAPNGTRSVAYRVERADSRNGEDLYGALKDALPRLDGHLSEPQKLFFRLLNELPCDDESRARLWLGAAAESGFVYTMDGFVQGYLRAAGDNLNEVIAGLRMGTCDSFAFHAARSLSELGLPALSIAGAMPRRKSDDFLMSPGHAQTAVPFPEGVEIYDLTSLTHQGHVRTLSWLEQRAELKVLAGADPRTAFESARIVRAKLIDRYKGDADTNGFFTKVFGYNPTRLEAPNYPAESLPGYRSCDLEDAEPKKAQEKPLEDIVRHARDGTLWSIWASLHGRANEKEVLEPADAPHAKGLEAMVSRLEMERTLARCKEEGSFAKLFKFLGANLACPEMDGQTKQSLPSCYSSLEGYRPHAEVVQLVHGVLFDQIPGIRKDECIDWLLEQLEPSDGEDCIFGDRLRYGWEISEAALGAQALIDFGRDEALMAMDNVQLVRFARVVALNPFMSVLAESKIAGEQRNILDDSQAAGLFDNETLRGLGEACARSVMHMKARRIALGDEIGDPLLAWAGCMGQHASKDPAAARAFGVAFEGLLELRGGAEGLVTLYERAEEYVQTRVRDLIRNGAESGLHGALLSTAPAALGEVVGRRIVSGLGHSDREFARVLTGLRELGLEADLGPHREVIEPAAKAAIRKLARSSKLPLINPPAPDRPASTFLAAYSKSHGAPLFQALHAIAASGGLESVEAIWPKTAEKKLASELAKHLKVNDAYSRPQYHVSLGSDSPARWAVHPAQMESASAQLTLPNQHAGLAISFIGARGGFEHPAEELLRQLQIHHPREAQAVLDNFHHQKVSGSYRRGAELMNFAEAGLIGRLFEKESVHHTYMAVRWLMAEGLVPEDSAKETHDSAKERLLELAGIAGGLCKEHAKDEGAIRAALEPRCKQGVSKDPGFTGLSWNARAAALLGYALTHGREDKRRGQIWAGAGIPNLIAGCLVEPSFSSSGLPSIDAWRSLYAGQRSQADLRPILQAAERLVEDLSKGGRPASSVFARYLYDRAGRVAPPSHSGDFDSIRHYLPGDGLNMVDWKSSARSDNLLVRQKRERETRPISLLVDAEWLAEGYQDWSDKKTPDYPHLKELFVQLLLAEKQRVDVELVIASRGVRGKLDCLIKKPGPDGRARFRSEDVLNELAGWITAGAKLAKAEQSMYGPSGYPGCDILGGASPELAKGSMVVAAMANKNHAGSLRHLELMRQQGRQVYLLGGT